MTNSKKLFSEILVLIFTLVLCTWVLVSCNKQEEEIGTEYTISINNLTYDENSLTVTVHLRLGDTGRAIPQAVQREYSLTRKNAYWNTVKNTYILEGAAIYSGVNSLLTQDELSVEGENYLHLKIVFDYATIYKSTTSDGNVIAEGRNYIHSFAIDESGYTQAVTQRDTPYTASWYGTLILAGLVFAVIALTITFTRGKYARRN